MGTNNGYYLSGITGQSGSRVMPGGQGPYPKMFLSSNGSEAVPESPVSDWDFTRAARGGGPGADGQSYEQNGSHVASGTFVSSNDGKTYNWKAYPGPAGGGGGWGAAGGDAYHEDNTPTYIFYPGGAGGKAIETNGHTVTWNGGSGNDRVFGVVG